MNSRGRAGGLEPIVGEVDSGMINVVRHIWGLLIDVGRCALGGGVIGDLSSGVGDYSFCEVSSV